ncbi:hypothetical protein [Pantoea vagans]|uniref:hypothetical protein n=1 Tax=Pantoea vagans TaxID=470934 RepID=UPI0028EB832B|nr:hypothetical protein [Pantoea vagans]
MEGFINCLTQETLNDVVVTGYVDCEELPVFHPMYERLFFIFSDLTYEVYLEDGLIKVNEVNEIKAWFNVDEDDRFSLMSIYSQSFKTEDRISISKVTYEEILFSKMSITYHEGDNERVLTLDPNNFFGFSFL